MPSFIRDQHDQGSDWNVVIELLHDRRLPHSCSVDIIVNRCRKKGVASQERSSLSTFMPTSS